MPVAANSACPDYEKNYKVCSRTDVAAACGLQKPLVHGKTDVKTTREAVVIHMLKNLRCVASPHK